MRNVASSHLQQGGPECVNNCRTAARVVVQITVLQRPGRPLQDFNVAGDGLGVLQQEIAVSPHGQQLTPDGRAVCRQAVNRITGRAAQCYRGIGGLNGDARTAVLVT